MCTYRKQLTITTTMDIKNTNPPAQAPMTIYCVELVSGTYDQENVHVRLSL